MKWRGGVRSCGEVWGGKGISLAWFQLLGELTVTLSRVFGPQLTSMHRGCAEAQSQAWGIQLGGRQVPLAMNTLLCAQDLLLWLRVYVWGNILKYFS